MLWAALGVLSRKTLKLGGALPPSDAAGEAPLLLASVASVRLKRRLGKLACAVLMRSTRLLITSCDWPASMSKSTPMSPDDIQRLTKVAKPASEPQVNEPPAPPVERMYLTPALASIDALAVAIAAPGTPPQFSL